MKDFQTNLTAKGRVQVLRCDEKALPHQGKSTTLYICHMPRALWFHDSNYRFQTSKTNCLSSANDVALWHGRPAVIRAFEGRPLTSSRHYERTPDSRH